MTLLPGIASPTDVRALDPAALPGLCAELREAIVAVCASVGGHLGASLGTVELTVALHRVFRTPVDALVFDTGHQAYAHKLLTGRGPRMGTLRQAGGVAPFTDPKESEHDAFVAGHASTAISAALGLLTARRLTGAPGRAVAVLGDGALTGGLAFEGLNNAGHGALPLCVVLNDNGMSISANVGAVPALLRENARPFFEALGFVYLGPIDGHDVQALEAALRAAKQSARPTLVHARTIKGKGFEPAEADLITRGHAMGPWELRDGKLVRSRHGHQTFSDAFAQALEAKMAADERVVAITPAMIEGSSLSALQARFPARVFDVGIAEAHAVTFAGGLAQGGLRPVVCLYSTFLQRAVDQLIHDVALPGLPVVVAVDRAGLVGADGATHQGAWDVAFARAVPGVEVVAAVTGEDLTALLDRAIDRAGPTLLRFPRGVLPEGHGVPAFPLDGARWLRRPAELRLTFVTLGPLGLEAVKACEGKPHWGVLDARYVTPLDDVALADAAAAGPLVVVEEGTPTGGLYSAVLEALARRRLFARVSSVALPAQAFVPHGEARAQRAELGLDAEGLARAAEALLC